MKMKSLLFISATLIAGSFALHAQNPMHQRTCGVLNHEQELQAANPARAIERENYEQLITNSNLRQGQPASATSISTLPVVVHIVLNQNLPVNQVLSQIHVLNQDFTRTNPDASNTPAAFQGVAANTTIQFCLAQQDPQGNWTSGIEYRQSSATFSNDNVKHYSTGGLDAWDPSRYFNIWVCDLSFFLGYAEFPTASLSNTYGVVIGYLYFGSNYTPYGSSFNLDPSFNSYTRGRTATHEIGHCFDLFHIWGDDGSACSGSDLCADTPNQADETYGAPSFPQVDACSPNSPGVMFMNYMDYTDDVAMNIFTNDQKTRMLAVLGSSPYNALTTSNACQPNGIAVRPAENLSVALYPNPANEQVNMEIAFANAESVSISITNALGQTVYAENRRKNNSGIYALDLSAMEAGIYFVEIRAGEERNIQRLVISH